MVVVGSAIMPHGSLILQADKIAHGAGEQVARLHEASVQIAQEVRRRKPHLIVLCTPHGITLDSGVHTVYMNKWAKGTAEFNGAGKQFGIECEIDVAAAKQIVQAMKRESVHVAGVEMFGGGENPAHIGWAEVVPLWFLDDVLSSCKVVFLSMANAAVVDDEAPRTRGQGQAELANVSEYVKMGQVLSKWMSNEVNSGRRIFFIASAGLSHGYGQCSPIQQVPASSIPGGFFQSENDLEAQSQLTEDNREASTLYDQAVELWVTSGQAEVLLLTARKAVALAQPCGYSSMVLLHGVLDEQDLSHWKRTLYACCCPSNFGMIAADFLPRWEFLPSHITDTAQGSLVLAEHGSRVPCWFLSPGAMGDIPCSDLVLVTKRQKIESPAPEVAVEPTEDPRPATETTKAEESEGSDEDEDDKFFESAIEEQRIHTAEKRRRAQQGDSQEEQPPPPPPWTVEFEELAGQVQGSIVVVQLAEEEDALEAIAALAETYHAMALIVIPCGVPTPPPLPTAVDGQKVPPWRNLVVVRMQKEQWEAAEIGEGARASIDWFAHPVSRPARERAVRGGRELGLASVRKEIDSAKNNAAAALAEEVHELKQQLAASEARRTRVETELQALQAEAKPSASGFAEALLASCRYRHAAELDPEHARAELFVLGFVKAHTTHYLPESSDLSLEASRLAAMVLQAYARRKVSRIGFLERASRARRFNGLLPDALTAAADRGHRDTGPARRAGAQNLRSHPLVAAAAAGYYGAAASPQPRYEFSSGVGASLTSPRALPSLRPNLKPGPHTSLPLASPGRSGGFLAASNGPRGSPRNLIRALPKETELEATNLQRYDFLSTSGAGGNLTSGRILPFSAQRSSA